MYNHSIRLIELGNSLNSCFGGLEGDNQFYNEHDYEIVKKMFNTSIEYI